MLSVVAHTCGPSYTGAGQLLSVRGQLDISLSSYMKNRQTKKQKDLECGPSGRVC
jgi:hypothetical protein